MMEGTWIFILLAMAVWLWVINMRYREHAILQSRKICSEMNLQLLDDTVTLKKISFINTAGIFPELIRKYSFEVSPDGVSRYSGYILLKQLQLIHIEIGLPEGPVILQKNESITWH